MRLLSLDTSSVACSVALQDGDRLFERHEEKPREHTRILLPMIRAVLAESGLAMHDLDAVVLGNGPGSFIGMRIAASVAQGIAYGCKTGIVPVSSLAAVAAEALADESVGEVVVAQDAHMNEVYVGHFARGDGGLPVPRSPERISACEPLAEMSGPSAGVRVAAGFGWRRYPELLEMNRAGLAGVTSVHHPRARFLLPLGAAMFRLSGGVRPQDVTPAYLRQKVAEPPPRTP